MISKRTRRASQPQETLRQFSLNNSKGVDETKAVTDINTVQSMENLKVNDDGSVSLRDPMSPYVTARLPYALENGEHIVKILQISSDLTILVLNTGAFGAYCTSEDDFVEIEIYNNSHTGGGYLIEQIDSFSDATKNIDLKQAELIHVSDAAILGNCTVSGIFDTREKAYLYDDSTKSVPRYLQAHYGGGFLRISIKNPEPNSIVQSEDGSLPIDVNTTLDNPYAIVDVYDSHIDVKGILLYAYSNEHSLIEVPEGTDRSQLKVDMLTESVKHDRWRPVLSLHINSEPVITASCFPYYKAFGNYAAYSPKDENSELFASWFYEEYDGTLIDVFTKELSTYVVRERESADKIVTHFYKILNCYSSTQLIKNRADCLAIDASNTFLHTRPLRFKIIYAKKIDTNDEFYDAEYSGVSQYKVVSVLDTAVHYPNVARYGHSVTANYNAGNSVLGKKLLYKNSIYSYGDSSFGNTIFKSYAGSLITPYTNSIDSSTLGSSKVSCIIPWRDYIYIATENAALLASPVENGFYIKTVNTFVGVPEQDSNCCKATLNGIIFKSGSKIFMGYPSLYSEADAVLNYTEISKPIENVLETVQYSECYAFNTASEYVLMLVGDSYTYSIRYNYVSKVWSIFKYPVPLKDAYVHRDGTIHAYHYYGERYMTEYTLSADAGDTYADVVFNGAENAITPIEFKWDTGQKTDSISNTKQFVESKLVFATLDERDSFPFTTYVAIDGDPHIVTTDISTDAPFWKNSESAGVLGTAFRLGGPDTPATGAFNTLRQLVLRYSGKGKSIRHVIEGESTCNFKLYETYVRYKNLNVK